MMLTGADDHLTKVFIHNDNQALLGRRQCQDSGVRHTGINITHRDYIQPLIGQPVFYGLADTDIHQDFHGVASA